MNHITGPRSDTAHFRGSRQTIGPGSPRSPQMGRTTCPLVERPHIVAPFLALNRAGLPLYACYYITSYIKCQGLTLGFCVTIFL